VTALDLTARKHCEALRGCAFGLDLWHYNHLKSLIKITK
jgi:hypothetical protein